MDNVIGPNRQHPTQISDAHADKRMRTERSNLNPKPHCDGRSMPTRCRQPFEYSFLSRFDVQMHRLRIELRCKTLDVAFCDLHLTAF